MEIIVSKTPSDLGQAAARRILRLLSEAIADRGEANYLVSTGASQFDTFDALLREDFD